MKMLHISGLLSLALGLPVLAEPLEPTSGYFIGCDSEGSPIYCYIQAVGVNWAISQDETAPDVFARLLDLPMLEPVIIAGTYGELGDSSAMLALSRLNLPPEEDRYVGNLRALQGQWQPDGEEAPFSVEVVGMDWLEVVNGEVETAYMMSVGETCADGVAPGGMAISLYRYDDDPAADACWQLEYIEDQTFGLRDFMGEQGQVSFTRLPSSN